MMQGQAILAACLIVLLIVVGAAMMLRATQRAIFYPRPREMPPPVPESTGEALVRFEAVLREHAPSVLEKLSPGLTRDQIRDIEHRYGLRLTDELRELYAWRNGSPRSPDEELFPGHRFIPLGEAAEWRSVLREQVADGTFVQRAFHWLFAGHAARWVAVFDDGCGAGYFYDPARGREGASFFYHFDEDGQYDFFPSLAGFLVGAAEAFESGIYRYRNDGGFVEDFDRAEELWTRYSVSNRR